MSYRDQDVFDLSTMDPYPLTALYEPFGRYAESVVLYLPRTADLEQVARVVQGNKRTVVMHYCVEGASKAFCAYIGEFDASAIL